MIAIIVSMPFISGQGPGWVVGLGLTALLAGIYWVKERRGRVAAPSSQRPIPAALTEAAEEITGIRDDPETADEVPDSTTVPKNKNE